MLFDMRQLKEEERAEREAWFKMQLEEADRQRAQRLSDWQQGFNAGYVLGWHNAMQEKDRQYWHAEGIPDWAIEQYQLGYCDKRSWRGEGGRTFESPAYVIPIREPVAGELVNIQYRLLHVPKPSDGKYRQENGLAAAAFYAEIGRLDGPCLVVEGAKKAIVMYDLLEKSRQLVGMPSQMPDEKRILALAGYSGVWLALDRDLGNGERSGYAKAVQRYAKLLPGVPVREISLPDKPDDMVVKYGMDRAGFLAAVHQARRVN
jgi:hypothetical protein